LPDPHAVGDMPQRLFDHKTNPLLHEKADEFSTAIRAEAAGSKVLRRGASKAESKMSAG
jgi:hypothetical protein